MTIRALIIAALLDGQAPMAGRDVAIAAGLPYKVAIDALARMHDAGTVARSGRKHSAKWLLPAQPTGPAAGMAALQARWHGRTAPPTPRGGAEGTSPPHSTRSVIPSKFFRPDFFAAL